MFIVERRQRPAPATANFVGQLDHLVNRLPAVETHHEVFHGSEQFRLAFRRAGLPKHLHHHRNHDLRPALANQRQRAVKIEQHRTEPSARNIRMNNLDFVVQEHGSVDRGVD